MKPVEFHRQIFRTPSHWAHGLSYRLDVLNGGGFGLFSRPAFTDWIVSSDEARCLSSLAVDDCGRIFWVHRSNCWFYRYDPISKLVEPVIPLAECSEGKPHLFGRMIYVARRLWILDLTGSRLIALRTDTFQIITEIPLSDPIDIAWGAGRLFVIDRNGIAAYDIYGRSLGSPRGVHLSRPLAIGADPKGNCVYVVDAYACGFLRFKNESSFPDEIGKFGDVAVDFRPRLLAIHPGGNLFVADGSKLMHEFSPDGGYIGSCGDMSPLSSIQGMTFDSSGNLYVGAPEGIARFGGKAGLAGNEGVFYTAALDSGGEGNDCWHRLDIVADVSAGGAFEVSYATSDDSNLPGQVTGIIEQPLPTSERAKALDELLDWKEPEELGAFSPVEATEDAGPQNNFRERSSHSMLFRTATGRYLWLRVRLSALSPSANVAIHEMRVYYPRLSYLRYLPAVYQEDPASKEFLERFLSIFETIFSGLEATIEKIPELFDPKLTPKEFLDWLAQWLDLGIEEEWPADVKRRLISEAASLYQKKGSPGGLAEFIEIVTEGRRPIIQESFETERPFILGEGSNLGLNTRIFRRPMADLPRHQRTILGISSILGTTQIRRAAQAPVNPFRAAANHFTLLLDLSPQEFQRYERGLHRIIRENSPAHVGYDIRLVSGTGLGSGMVLGVSTRVEDLQPLYLGHSNLSRSILKGFRYGPEVGIDATLAGEACKSNSDDFSYGER